MHFMSKPALPLHLNGINRQTPYSQYFSTLGLPNSFHLTDRAHLTVI